MRIIFRYLIILAAFIIFGCKSTKIVSEPNSRKTEMEFYKNGLLKSIGQIDSNYLSKAARIGLWSEFYENGKLKENTTEHFGNAKKTQAFPPQKNKL